MVLTYSTFQFVLNLAAVTIIAAPLFHLAKSDRARNIILGCTGMVLTFYIAPRLLIFFAVYWLVTHVIVRWLADRVDAENDPDQLVFFSAILLLLLPMLWWRLSEAQFLATLTTQLNDLLRFVAPQIGAIDRSSTILPVGMSFGIFRAIDLLIKTSLGVETKLKHSEMFAYAFFPSVLVIGPIIERKEIAKHKSGRLGNFKAEDYWVGAVQVLVGVAKVFVFSRPLEQFRAVIDSPELYSAWQVWIGLALFYVSFYLNFAGYSDIAIGFGRFFGFTLLPNFRSPLVKGSPRQFWNTWHMSLTRFAQRNVFVPLGGFRKESRNVATAVTMMVIALWHGVSFGLVLFGIWHTCGILFWPDERPDISQGGKYLRVGATFVFVLVSLPLLLTTTGGAFDVYASMIGLGA